MIHVCFALYDKVGHYSKFTGTAILSLLENTNIPPPSICIHFLHDNTLTDDNRDKFIQLTESYGQIIKFYNVEELCAERIEKIKEFFPNIGNDRHSIAMFYRLFIPQLFSQKIEKVLYLDSDVIVNLDITELWQIELGNRPFGAVPEIYQFYDKDVGINTKKVTITICKENVVDIEDYFNSGVMLMNLKVLRKEEDTILAGMKFISEHPQFTFLDQDLLNYCFSTMYLKLPNTFNRFVLYAKRENDWSIQEKIYHYAASRICFVMDSRDLYNQLFMRYFIKTPWVDADTRLALSGEIPSRKNYPVSVVIPLYNEEEYIGECLDSLLLQTFQAFEVIVVDDCSTDNSIEVVESYAPKFNGRLKLLKTEKNSGTGGYVSRNIGLNFACGEYVYFMDADDFILLTALETFYAAAILYDADVVYTKSCYFLNAPNDIALYKDFISRKSPNINTEFTLNDTDNNLRRLLSSDGRGEFNTIQTTFCRREFLLVNRLFFPEIARTGDFLWVVNVYCHVKRFLRISTPLCLRRRYNLNSLTRMVRDPQEQCSFWFAGLVEFAESLNELKNKNEHLVENPAYNLTILRKNILWSLDRTDDARKELGSEGLFKVLYNEFSKNLSDLEALLFPFFFSFIDSEVKIKEYYSKIVNKFNRYFTARIDVKFMSTNDDFQIVSVSDNKAYVRKPKFLQKDGIGYQIQSYEGNIKLVAKATADGQIQIYLRGMDIRDPEANNRRIPYWIDYTAFTVNGTTIFDKLTPTWHDKPFQYNMEVKADEEIVLDVEWLPHRSDAVAVEDNVDYQALLKKSSSLEKQLVTTETNLKAEIETLQNKTVALENLNDNYAQIFRKFSPYLTARIDIRLISETKGGKLRILSVSDSNAGIVKPRWFRKKESGYSISSCVGKLKIVAQSTVDGKVQLYLRGKNVPDPEDKNKRIPYWIDYTAFTVNDAAIFDELTPTWHDKPYTYVTNVTADEEIILEVEWLPHRSDAVVAEENVDHQALLEKANSLEEQLTTTETNLKAEIETLQNKTVELENLNDNYAQMFRNFSSYLTARIDIRFIGKTAGGKLQILSVSDSNADIIKPKWFRKRESGYSISSCVGKLKIVAQSTVDGKVQLYLRGKNVPDPEDKDKRIPYWIDYTAFVVNETTIFNERTPTWHDKPFHYNMEVTADEEIVLEVEWLPHRSDT